MKREMYNDLMTWKSSINKKSLLLLGARQVGKTYLVRQFGKECYKNFIEINFEFDLTARSIFDSNLDLDELIMKLSMHTRQSITEETLIFFDEIQVCPRAIVSLKLFSQSKYDVIASGSLLGVSLNHISSFPVGYIETKILYPLNFKEFLWSQGIQNNIIDYLHQCFNEKKLVDEFIHKQMNELLLKYVVIGGMPAVINQFNADKDFESVINIQKQIISDYRNDMAKYSSNTIKEKVKNVYDSLCDQLAMDNKKFQYKIIKPGGNARYYASSIDWIVDSGLAHKVNKLKTIDIPLKAYRDPQSFKLYLNDTGLLLSMYEENMYLKILNGELGVFKGGVFENLVYIMLKTNHQNIYYYEKGQTEIDFVTLVNNEITPIEVKSGYNTRSKSLKQYIEKYRPTKAIKLSLNNLNCNDDTIECYPLYMTMFI